MSAFLCTPEHIGALAAYAAENRMRLYFYDSDQGHQNIKADEETPAGDGRHRVAVCLALANLDSLRERYPDTNQQECAPEWGPYDSDQEYVLACVAESRRFLRYRSTLGGGSGLTLAASIFNMCRCYWYQSCEVPRFDLTVAGQLVRQIQDHAAHKLAEGQSAAIRWEYSEQRERAARV